MLAKLFPPDSQAVEIFLQAKSAINMALSTAEIHHVGSTSVPGLGGKGMVDILVAIPEWQDNSQAVEALKSLGYTHVNPPRPEYIFLSRVGETIKGDIHLHLTSIGSKEYKNLLAFRDYLRTHDEERNKYLTLKQLWVKDGNGDRKYYSNAKNNYIVSVLSKAVL